MSTHQSAIPNIAATLKGMIEFRSDLGMTYGDSRDEAYDLGRELAHRLTFRKWDHNARDYFCYSPSCERETIWNGEFCSKCGREWGYPL